MTQISYPEKYYSESLNRLLHATPKLPQEPKKPIKPKEHDDSNKGCFVFFFIIEIIIFIYVLSSTDFEAKGTFFVWGGCDDVINIFPY